MHCKAWYTLAKKSTVAETGDKLATRSTVADSVHFVVDTVDFVASVYEAKATTTLSTFNEVHRVEFSFVASVLPDDVSHCRILSPDKTEWWLILTTLCG